MAFEPDEELHWRLWGETSAYTSARPAVGCICRNFFDDRFTLVAVSDVGATLERLTYRGLQRHDVSWAVLGSHYLFPSQ